MKDYSAIAEELKQLKKLLDLGILTEVEYQERKAKILNGSRDEKITELPVRKHKKKKGWLLGVLGAIAVAVAVFFWVGTQSNTSSVQEALLSFSEEYQISETEVGTFVTVTAPDFPLILRELGEQGASEVGERELVQQLSRDEVPMREFVFQVEEQSPEAIQGGFLDSIAFEILVSALEEIQIADEWEVE